MHPTDHRAFAHQLLVCTLAMICFTGSIGLGAVWMRHQISLKANSTKQLEQQITETERHLAELGMQITAEQSVDVLARRNAELHLGLVPPGEPQVVRVAGSPEQWLGASRPAGEFAAGRPRVTAVRFQLGGRAP